MNTGKAGRYRTEVELAHKRDDEERHHQYWTDQQKYYETFQRANERFATWTSDSIHAESMEKHKKIEDDRKKQEEKEEKRNKLDLIMHEEKIKQEVALKEERKNRLVDETPTEVLQTINLGLKQKEEAKKRHEAELKLYEHWKTNNPDIRESESKQRASSLKVAWLDAQVEKQMNKEKEEEDMRLYIEARNMLLEKNEELERQHDNEIREREIKTQTYIEKQISDLKKKEEEAEVLQHQEREILRHRDEVDKIADMREEEQKHRRRLDIDVYNLNQYRLKLRRRAKIVAEEVAAEKKFYERILDEDKLKHLHDEVKKKHLKESVISAIQKLKEQQELEAKREEYLSLIFDSEAKLVWEKQERLWREEQFARDNLFKDVIETIKEQIEFKAKEKIDRQKELIHERETMVRCIDEINDELKQLKEESEKKKAVMKEELDKQINDKNEREKMIELIRKKEEEKKLEDAKQEEIRLNKEIDMLQLGMKRHPYIPRSVHLW